MAFTIRDGVLGLTLATSTAALVIALQNQQPLEAQFKKIWMSDKDGFEVLGLHAGLGINVRSAAAGTIEITSIEDRTRSRASITFTNPNYLDSIFIGNIKGQPYMGFISPDGKLFYPVLLGQPVPTRSNRFPYPDWPAN